MKPAGVVLAVLCSLAASAARTQDEPSAPKRPGLKESALAVLNHGETKDGRGLHYGPFVPRVEVLSSGGGPAPVLHFWAPDIGGGALDFHASAAYSIYKYQYYDLQFGLLPHVGNRLPRIDTGTNGLFPLADIEKTASAPGFNVYASARYRDYPRDDFYGMGPDTLRVNRADYRLQDGLYEGVVRLRVARLSLMGRAGVLRTTILPGGDPNDPNVEATSFDRGAPGLLRAPDFTHVSVGAWLELRDQPRNPHRGAVLGLAYSRFDERNGGAHDFNRLTLDAREYLRLGSNRHVVALRQTASFDRADAGSTVPFYLRQTLGGGRLLRGYPSFRFRDNGLLYLASEYRFEVRPKLELALLYEAGKVFANAGGFDLQRLRGAYGAGIRLKSLRRVHLRLDVLRSVEGTRIQFKLGPSF